MKVSFGPDIGLDIPVQNELTSKIIIYPLDGYLRVVSVASRKVVQHDHLHDPDVIRQWVIYLVDRTVDILNITLQNIDRSADIFVSNHYTPFGHV